MNAATFAQGKYRSVQICLVCKAAGNVKMSLTVMEIIAHVNKDHAEEK